MLTAWSGQYHQANGTSTRLALNWLPVADTSDGTPVLGALNLEYGESPDQGAIQARGNAYLKSNFPNLDYIKTARIVP